MTGPVVPAGGEELRAILNTLMPHSIGCVAHRSAGPSGCVCGQAEQVDAAIPVLTAWREAEARRRAAEVLRAAAAEQRAEAGNVPDTDEGTHADGHRCAATFLDRRAAALAPENARPE